MTQGRSPTAALDDILSQTRHLLLSFNGPICPLFADTSDMAIAEHLRSIVTRQDGDLPAEIGETADWQKILTYAATISSQLAESVESELTKLESASAQATDPTPHLHELIAACRESGRSVAIISTTSTSVIHSYIADHSLGNAIGTVIARTSIMPITPIHQIEQVVAGLKAASAECIVVTTSTDDINAARQAGAHSIGYGKYLESRNALMKSGADSVISGFADLTLRIRAQRPNM